MSLPLLASWSACAFAGAGWIAGLPAPRAVLCAITAVYLLRGAVLLPALVLPRRPATAFWIWSSAICLAIGGVHLAGLVAAWPRLA